MQQNNEEITKSLKMFFQPGDVFEIRCLGATIPGMRYPHTESGYFDYEHIGSVPKELEKIEARGVYFTPNPVNPALLARAANRIKPAGKNESTADADILRRRWLLIDCDAVRPSGISASNVEHEAALYKTIEISDGLSSMGLPEAVMIDSGNGAQLMYRIDLPVEDDDLVKSCLQALVPAGSDEVKIDVSVHNPARIWRLPGTINRKGDDIPERPHRMAQIISAPENPEVVPVGKLQEIVGESTHKIAPPETLSTDFDLESWIARYYPEAEGPEPWKNGRKWILPVCPFNEAHDNRSAVIIQQANGAIAFKCHHDGCAANDWHVLRELKETQNIAMNEPKVDLTALFKSLLKNKNEHEKSKPWRNITDADIEKILQGTCLGAMNKIFSSVTNPPLPLAAVLPKSIALAGCALSEKNDAKSSTLSSFIEEGVSLARLRIDTAGGLAGNCYIMLVAPSTSGKDIGNLLELTAKKYGWKIASAGSAEGIADALAKINNGLITISELQNWLDKRHWQHKATVFLTEAFNKGSFEHAFSVRGRGINSRSANFCFPSIIAHIQPEVFDIVVNKQDVSSGFLGRFLFCRIPDFDGRPARIDLDYAVRELSLRVDAFRNKRGLVVVPDDYLNELFEMFKDLSHEKMHSSWKRLVNEYGPKLAVMLSVADRDFSEKIMISDEVWRKTSSLLQWFFAHAERMLMGVDDGNEFTKLRERLFKKIFKAVTKFMPEGARKSDISNYAGYGSTKKERDEALVELIERGVLSYKNDHFIVSKTPPGWYENS